MTAADRRLISGALELVGQAGEVLAERDLVAGLLVGQAHLAVAELADTAASGAVAGRPAPRASMSWPSSVSWLASSVDTAVTRASRAATRGQLVEAGFGSAGRAVERSGSDVER